MFDAEITAAATRLLDTCKAAGVMVATAESCTGGLIAGALTEIAGSLITDGPAAAHPRSGRA